MAAGGEHERVPSVVPRDTGEVSTNSLCTDVVQERAGLTVPDVDISSWQRRGSVVYLALIQR